MILAQPVVSPLAMHEITHVGAVMPRAATLGADLARSTKVGAIVLSEGCSGRSESGGGGDV